MGALEFSIFSQLSIFSLEKLGVAEWVKGGIRCHYQLVML